MGYIKYSLSIIQITTVTLFPREMLDDNLAVDESKLERFCQFRREIRGSKEHLIVGIDIAKDKHYAFFGTSTGKTLFEKLIFDNNYGI